MTKEELMEIERGAVRWESVSATTVLRLIDYIRRLERENAVLQRAVGRAHEVV